MHVLPRQETQDADEDAEMEPFDLGAFVREDGFGFDAHLVHLHPLSLLRRTLAFLTLPLGVGLPLALRIFRLSRGFHGCGIQMGLVLEQQVVDLIFYEVAIQLPLGQAAFIVVLER